MLAQDVSVRSATDTPVPKVDVPFILGRVSRRFWFVQFTSISTKQWQVFEFYRHLEMFGRQGFNIGI